MTTRRAAKARTRERVPAPRASVRLLAVDIDGTLLNSSGQLPEAHRQALAEAQERGIALVLATGRAQHFAQPVADRLGLAVALIVNNGAVVRAPDGRTALRHVLARGVARAILEETRAFEDSVAVVFDRCDDRQIVFERMDWSHPNRRGYYAKNRAFIASAPLTKALDEDPIQVMFNGSVEPMRRLAASLRGMPIADRFTVAITEYEARDFALVDVNGPGCSKGSTLARYAAVVGVPREQVMAVGDNLNDREMLAFAGVPVVMGNATDAMKSRGYPVVPTHDEDGLAVAIRRFALAGEASARRP
jgi:Cof subfamily protein (haloacid dehalogenase superfamily)